MSRPTMRFVPVKSSEQQASLMLIGMRERLVRNRTQLANAIRGYAAEFGLTAAKGMCKIEPLLDRIATHSMIPALARELFASHGEEFRQLNEQLDDIDAKLRKWHRGNECSRRLAQIPGVGLIGASLLMMKTPAPELFASGRQFAAWMGLTPKDHSTAGKSCIMPLGSYATKPRRRSTAYSGSGLRNLPQDHRRVQKSQSSCSFGLL